MPKMSREDLLAQKLLIKWCEIDKALQNWKIFLKAFSKWLRKLTIKTKQLWWLKYFSFVNVND